MKLGTGSMACADSDNFLVGRGGGGGGGCPASDQGGSDKVLPPVPSSGSALAKGRV